MTEIDRESREAVSLLVSHLREARQAGETDPLGADAEPFAQAFIAALKGIGWRPVLVLPPSADWRRAGTPGSGAPLDPAVKAELLGRFAAATDGHRRGTATGGQPALTPERERELLREGPDP